MRIEDRLLIKNLAQTAELVNTLNGGMSQPNIQLIKSELEWTLRLRVPGVSADQLKLELKDGQLYIFQLLTDHNVAEVELPYLLTAFNLSNRVDHDNIRAHYDGKQLFITLPLDAPSDGFAREIEILKG